MPIPILPLVIAAAIYFGRSKKTLESLTFEPNNIFWSKSLKKFVLKIEIVNPRSQSAQVENIFLAIFDNDKKVGTIEKTSEFTIEKASRTMLEIPIKFNAVGIATTVIQLIKEQNNPEYIYEKDSQGKIKTDANGKPIIKKDSKGKLMRKKSSHTIKVAGTAKVFGLDVPISEEVTLDV